MPLLAYAVGTVLLCAAAWRSRSRFVLFLLQFLPFVFLFGFLWFSQDGYRTLQVRKLGYEFEKTTGDYRSPARVVKLGGDREKDDLYSESLPAGAIRIIPSLVDTSIEIETTAGGILIERNGSLLNSVELEDGDTIEVAKREVAFRGGGSRTRAIRSGSREWKWPSKTWESNRVRRPDLGRSLEEQFYGLLGIGQQLEMPLESAAVVGLKTLHMEWSRRPVRMNRVFLAGYEPGITINRKPLKSRWKCSDGDTLRFFSLEKENGSLRARRIHSFVVRNTEFLSVLHSNPQTLGMREDLLQSGGSKPLLLTTTALPYSAFPAITYDDESAQFSGIVAFVQPQSGNKDTRLFPRLYNEFMDRLALNASRFEVVTDGGTLQPLAGEQIALGKTDRMLFTLDRTRFPWAMLYLLLLLLVLRAIFHAPVFPVVPNLAGTILLSIVDFFLTTRLLFAFRAQSLYPFSQETVPLALLVWLLLPYLLFTAAMLLRSSWTRSDLLHFGLYTFLMAGIGAYLLPGYAWLSIAIGITAALAAGLRFHPRSPLLRNPDLLHKMSNASPGLLLALPAVLALILQLAGVGEAVRVSGIRVPLALLYHPLLLWLTARALTDLYHRLTLRQDITFRNTMLAGGRVLLILAVFFVISFFTSDFGFFLLYCVPLLFALFGIAVMYIAEYELRVKAAGLLLAAPVLCMLLLFSSYSTINRLLPETYFNSRAVQRILLAVDPEALEETGLVAAERQLGHQRMFLAYSRSGWTGEGYGKRAISPALASTALNDNVPAVFLLNDFGGAGFAAACLMLIAMAWFWLHALRTQEPARILRINSATMLSMLSLVTWIFAALYMLLANCGILLFTGKNVFLWGLNSTSDLFHSAALLALVILPLARTSEEAVPQTAVVPATEPAAVGELI